MLDISKIKIEIITKQNVPININNPVLGYTQNKDRKSDRLFVQVFYEDIKKLEPLNSKNISAYLLDKEKISDILNSNLGLIDDRLLSSFNEINTLYDKMRDIEWENTND